MSKTRNDIILAVVLLLLSVAGLLLYKSFQSDGSYAVVLIDGEETARFSLDEDTEYVINGSGTNTLLIKDGKADIVSADCPDGICVDHAPISKVGQTIVCLPHGVVIAIKSDNTSSDEIDMVA